MIVIDLDIYPRKDVDAATVEKYAGAMGEGAVFPPIIVERGTGRLLDGLHRYRAYERAGIEVPEPDQQEVPAGMTALLYAAHLQAKHGLPLEERDTIAIARRLFAEGDETTVTAVAKAMGQPRKTVESWLSGELEERREKERHDRNVRQAVALMLREAGWTQQRIADHLGITQSGASRLMHDGDGAVMHNEQVIGEAVTAAPIDVADIAERWREQRIFATWTQYERNLLEQHRAGRTVVVSMRDHKNLWRWAEAAGVAVRVDRKSPWGNPFLLGDDGPRADVIRLYAEAYWPHKKLLRQQVGTLRGKILGCWCHPQPCHGDHIAKEAGDVDG